MDSLLLEVINKKEACPNIFKLFEKPDGNLRTISEADEFVKKILKSSEKCPLGFEPGGTGGNQCPIGPN